MISGGEEPRLWEREAAIAALDEALRLARRGQGTTLLLVGEAGLGKTALLRRARARARAAGFRCGHARGESAESILPFGFLDQALRGLDAEDVLRPLPELAAADQSVAMFHRAHSWLRNLGTEPVLLALDDLHWADADSLTLLGFLCRRLDTAPLAVVGTLRPWPPPAALLCGALEASGQARALRLSPLSQTASSALLAEVTGRELPASAQSRLHQLCAGNPLLLRHVADDIDPTGEVPTGALAAPLRERVLLSRFTGMGARSLEFARIAAVFGVRFRPRLVPALSGLTESEARDCLAGLCANGLVRDGGAGWAEFTHPLLQEVLYQDLPPPLRAELHGLAFHTLWEQGEPAGEAAEHALRADLRGDPQAVAALQRAGLDALARGALAGAGERLRAAARFTGSRIPADALLALAGSLLLAGAAEEAAATCRPVVDRSDATPAEQAAALRLLGRALFQSGAADEEEAAFAAAADRYRALDPATAAEVLLEAAQVATYMRGPRRARALAEQARALVPSSPPSQLSALIEISAGMADVLLGDGEGFAVVEAALAQITPERGRHGAWEWGPRLAHLQTAKIVERFDAAQHSFEVGLADAERAGSPLEVSSYGAAYADSLVRQGRLDQALELLGQSRAVARFVPGLAPWTTVGLAHLNYELDRPDEALRYCDEVEAAMAPVEELVPLLRLWWLQVRAGLALEAERAELAADFVARAEAVAQVAGVLEPCVVPWRATAIAAYGALGRHSDLRRVVEDLEAGVARLPCAWPRGVAARGRAMLADQAGDRDLADCGFAEAVRWHRQVPMPLAEAESLLAYGSFLRRNQSPSRARGLLGDALRTADRCGARRLSRRVHAELRAAGGRRPKDSGPGLTVQERRIGELATLGLTNAEIGQRLFISGRTVEHHLAQVYAKLGLSSRRQLSRSHALALGSAQEGGEAVGAGEGASAPTME